MRAGVRSAFWHRVLSVVLGAAMALGHAPWGLWPLTLLALAGLMRTVAVQRGVRAAALQGFLGGLGYFAVALSWIVEPFLIDIGRHGWMAPFALVGMAAGMALFWSGAAALARWLMPGPLAFAATLATVEMARGYVLTGFPWAMIGHVWVGTPVDQVAALVGPSGLTLLTTLAAAGVATATMPGVATGAAVLAAAAAFGVWRLALPSPPDRGVTVRLVQPNVDQARKWDREAASGTFDALLGATAAEPRPDLIVWPETSVPYLLDLYPEVGSAIAKAGAGVPVIVGYQRVDGAQVWNALAAVGAGGSLSAHYDKHHLVPFGEYIPLGDLAWKWFGIGAFAANIGNGYSAGPGPRVLDLGPELGRVLPLICYEAVFPQGLRGVARADWLLQITNDAWFGVQSGPWQHLAQARLRAIEQGLPMVRVANTGISGVIDARGRVVARIEIGEAAWRDVPLPGALPQVPTYARFGEGPVLALLAALAAIIALARRRGRA